jgi:hypothetical protein
MASSKPGDSAKGYRSALIVAAVGSVRSPNELQANAIHAAASAVHSREALRFILIRPVFPYADCACRLGPPAQY